MYVIKRTDQGGGYLSRSGSDNTYTNKLELAKTFETREGADAGRCPENEYVVNLDSILS